MKVSGKESGAYRVTLPKDACNHLGIKPGDVVVFSVLPDNKGLKLVKS